MGKVLARRLKEYMPTASKYKILQSSAEEDLSKTTKSTSKEHPSLASLSAHLFPSLYIYIMIIYGEKRLQRRKKMVVMIHGFQFNKWHKTSY